MNFNNRLVKRGLISALLAIAITMPFAHSGHATDLSGSYNWKPVRIGAGGWMRGMVVHSSNPNVRYARGDVDNIYRWDNTNSTWVPMEVAGALPAGVTAAPAGAGAGPIAVDPNNANVVLCGWHFLRSADIQGSNPDVNMSVYRSTDGGRSFTGSNLSLPGTPSNPNASDLSGELRGERMMIDPNNSNVVYLGSQINGLWRSMDGGATWSNVTANGAPSSTSNTVLPRFDGGAGTVSFGGQTVSKRIYLTMDNGPILQSNDGGNSWTNISAGHNTESANIDGNAGFATVDTAGNLWVANTANGYIAKYTRAGVWSGSQAPHGVAGIAVDPNNPNRIFLIGGGGSLGRSLNGGATWTDLGSAMNYSPTQGIQWLRPSAIRPNGHFESCSGLYMDSAGKLWVCGGNDGIQTCTPNDTTDSAANPPVWTSNSQGIEEMVGQAITVPPGGNPIEMVEDEGLFTIFNPDLFTARHHTLDYWTNNTGLSIGQNVAYCPNQPKFIAETSDNGFYGREPTSVQRYSGYSTDGGVTWNKFASITNGTQPCPLYCGLIAVSARVSGHQNDAPGADNIVWAPATVIGATPPAPFYSTNGGATWTQTHSFDSAPGASTVNKCGVNYTYLGFQWGPWTNLIHQHNLESDPLIPGTFYMDMTMGGFWKTTNGGVTWTQQTGTGLPQATHHGQLRANPNASGDLWYVDGYEGAWSHGLYHTTDGGASFTRSAAFTYAWELALGKSATVGGYPAIFVYGKLASDPNWGVFRSTDQGATWDRISFYPTDLIDPPASMAASWDTFGQVYISFQGDSAVYGSPASTTPPPAPSGLLATPGSTQIMLAWNVAGGATSYSIYRGTAAGGESATAVAAGISATTYTDTGLTNGTTYYYKITAVNNIGASGFSNEANATPAPQPPPAPAGLTATPGNTQVSLAWTGSPGATSYNALRSTVSGSGYASVATGIGTTTYTNTGLTNGTTYSFVVTATNAAGTSGNSYQASATPIGAGTPIIQINAGGGAAGSYIADTDFVGGNTSSTANTIDTSAVTNPAPQAVYQTDRWANPGTVTYTIPGLAANGSYAVRLHFTENYFSAAGQRKFNVTIQGVQVLTNFDIYATAGAQYKATAQQFPATSNGSGQIVIAFIDGALDHAKVNGIEVLTATSSPGTPTGLTATAGNAQVALSWTASPGATGYNVKRSTVSGSGYATISSPATAGYTNTGLLNGATYFYVVSAVNNIGESGNSAQVSATPAGSAAAAFVTLDTTTQGTWKGVYGGDGYNISQDPSANNPSYPAYATVSFSGIGNYTWLNPTTDVRAPQLSAVGSTDRIAAAWYTPNSADIDVNLTGGGAHKIALYCLDWDTTTRSETIQVLDGVSSAVLDTQTISGFHGGQYVVWNISGHVKFHLVAGTGNAVVNGLFFNSAGGSAPPAPTGLTATLGN